MKTNLLYILTAVILFTSCDTPRYVYAPSPPNNPYFKEKGDTKISGYYSIGGDDGSSAEKNHGYDIQAAYAVTDHFAVTFDHFFRYERDAYNFYEYNVFDSSSVKYKRNITGIGTGYFREMNRRGTVTFNLYGGVGLGKFSINDRGIDDTLAVYSRFYKSNITRWYLQPGFNFMSRGAFSCAVTTRFVFAKYSGVRTSYSIPEREYFDLKNLNGRTLGFFEPSYSMQVEVPHCPWLKLNASLTFSANITPERVDDYDSYYHSRGVCGSFGLTFDPSKISGN